MSSRLPSYKRAESPMATAPLYKLDAQDPRCAFLTFADGCDKLVLRAPTRADIVDADFIPATDAEVQQAFDLVAAAPEMLALLLECLEPVEDGDDCPLPAELYNKVCAVVNRVNPEG